MTDSIQPTKAWVESNVPPLGAHPTAQLPQDLMRIRLNTVTAACFAMSLKYAGTEDESAHHTLLVYFDELKQLTSRSAIGYEANLTCASAQACLNILCISSALVMAGSGDISVMKRLRALHAVKRERTYGDYMASHMALGILFLGGGARFTIANTRESMAMLIIALFPRFPRTVADNYEHLQAWRHLWAMCVQPRCLVVRDAQSGALCNSASVTLTYEGRSGNVPMIVRPLQRFPDLESVESLSVHASGFLPLEINFSDSPAAKDILTKRRAIYISSSDSPFKSAMVGLTPARFERWLNRTCDSAIELADVVKAAFELKSPGVGQTMDQGKIANILENVRQLRVCVLAARTPGFIRLRKNHIGYEKLQWAERATLAWMDVYARVRLLAKTKNAQQALYTYWANDGLAPDSNEVEHTAVALMYTALDLPAPDDVASVAKEVSLTSLVSYCLR
ncbi:Anaphase-promoting complex subunit 1 [Linderina macrospora]|uniref:Anaphase-promoting complex subunit 1 n=1 Tax=Linderina macrospora TaxID=4868 RepID=A0ACC1JC05_9FUNG|nr:Anaphase-promoting complex subunit 1 [Linderina macrospora]